MTFIEKRERWGKFMMCAASIIDTHADTLSFGYYRRGYANGIIVLPSSSAILGNDEESKN